MPAPEQPDEAFVSGQLALRRELEATDDNLRALRCILIGAPTYGRLVTGQPSDGSTAASIFSERPPGTTAAQKYVFGLYLDHLMIGCLDAIRAWPNPTTCHIGLLLFDERYQRRGFGRRAMLQLCDEVARWGSIESLRLGVVSTNAPAFPFWRAMGFAETGERKQNPAFAGDVVIMAAPLDHVATAAGVRDNSTPS